MENCMLRFKDPHWGTLVHYPVSADFRGKECESTQLESTGWYGTISVRPSQA